MFKGSNGQTTAMRLMLLNEAFEGKNFPIRYLINRDDVNEQWQFNFDFATKFFVSSIEVGPTTILMDEPDRNLDFIFQKKLWDKIINLSQKAQVIIASHSLFALGRKEANYIDLIPDYREKSQKEIFSYCQHF